MLIQGIRYQSLFLNYDYQSILSNLNNEFTYPLQDSYEINEL